MKEDLIDKMIDKPTFKDNLKSIESAIRIDQDFKIEES